MSQADGLKSSELDPLYLEGVRLFNQREFFACHDALEEVWDQTLGADRSFYQGLIHAAVALHHFEEGNLTGARKMYDSCLRYLRTYGNEHLGLDLHRLRTDMRRCFEDLLVNTGEYPAGVTLDADRVPTLCLEYSPREEGVTP